MMLRIICLLLCISSSINAQIYDCEYGGGNYYTVTAPSGLMIRKDRSLEADIVHKMSYGAEVFVCDFCRYSDSLEVDNIKGVWKKVCYNDFEGYAFDGYLKPERKIELMSPNDWASEDWSKPIFREGEQYFGIYRDEDVEHSKVMRYENRDSLIMTVPFAAKKLKMPEENPPGFIVTGLDFEEFQLIEGRFYNFKMLYPGESIFFGRSCIYATGRPVKRSRNGEMSPFSAIEDYELAIRAYDDDGNYKEELLYNQPLYDFGLGDYEGGVSIRWIGDLDGDEKMDVLLTVSEHYAYYEVVLLLSTKAQGKRLLGEVARYGVSGC